MKKILALFLAGTVLPAWGGFDLRYAYHLSGAEKEITVQLMNEGNRSALWFSRGLMMVTPTCRRRKFRYRLYNASGGKGAGVLVNS